MAAGTISLMGGWVGVAFLAPAALLAGFAFLAFEGVVVDDDGTGAAASVDMTGGHRTTETETTSETALLLASCFL